MGISRDSRHKHRLTGGRRNIHQKKRKFELGRPAAMTKLDHHHGGKRVRTVRGRGGNLKFRALRLDCGNFAWGTQNISRKARILDVVYNASNNELVRTKTLVKGAIVQVECAPFKAWFMKHYGRELGKKGKAKTEKETEREAEASKHVRAKLAARYADTKVDENVDAQFGSGRVLVRLSSRPGQCGRADGYILEGEELQFYKKKLERKKKA